MHKQCKHYMYNVREDDRGTVLSPPETTKPRFHFRIDPETGTLDLFQSVDLLAGSPIPPEDWHYPLQVRRRT